MAINLQDSEGRKLFGLLCQAAGVSELKVRAIECRCEVKSPVVFRVETIGEDMRIGEAIGDGKWPKP